MKLDGQWFGTLQSAQTAGDTIINLDRRRGGFSGSAILKERQDLPGEIHAVTLRVAEAGRLNGHTDLVNFFTTRSGRYELIHPTEVSTHFPNLQGEVLHATITGDATADSMTIQYNTGNAEADGIARCFQVPVPEMSIVERELVPWEKFKAIATQAMRESDGLIYRGQLNPWSIRTSFHRAGRFDLFRFSREDIRRLESAVTSVLDTPFQLDDNRHLGALLGIAQHHGFPTPLLDWTKSPYVAAYFACRDALQREDCLPTIFRLDRGAWLRKNAPAVDITEPLPSIGFIEPLPLRNARLLPQQSVLVFCNVDNFEALVKKRETEQSVSYLKGYMLAESPAAILKELRLMGVYAASLFPGLDGMCRGVFEDALEAD